MTYLDLVDEYKKLSDEEQESFEAYIEGCRKGREFIREMEEEQSEYVS
jgi:hypothetical protein